MFLSFSSTVLVYWLTTSILFPTRQKAPQHPLLEGGGPFPFGTNGIRLDPEREHVVFAVSTSSTNPALGKIYQLPLVSHPEAADLEVVHSYVAGELPDQLPIIAPPGTTRMALN